MERSSGCRICVAFSLLLSLACSARAEVKVSSVFGSRMVVQQDLPVPVWGWADPGEKITVRLDDQKPVSAEAEAKGNWRVTLEPLKADGKPHTLIVSGKNTITLEDILIGEVWVGSGQSNMAMGLGKAADASANQPEIRLLQVPAAMSKTPNKNIEAEWKVCSAETAAGFSSVLYHFGTRLHGELKVPIGLINASRGSTAIQQFMPPPAAGPLFNGSIAPLIPVGMRGAIWYQGEANAQQKDGLKYADRVKTMLEGWRSLWGREFPFYFVQLAPLANYEAGILPPLWEAQLACLKIPRTGVAIINDLAGNMRNIHPGNKDEVGYRLARWALARDYGRKDVVVSGPLYKSMKVEGKSIRLSFAHTAGGLKSRDGKPLTEFQISGGDGSFVAARARIDGETVVVEAEQVAEPTQVRFAWQNAPNSNLVNAAGLPASAFHTNDWQGGTGE